MFYRDSFCVACFLERAENSPCRRKSTACRMDSCADSLAAFQISPMCRSDSLPNQARNRGIAPDLFLRHAESECLDNSSKNYVKIKSKILR